MCKLSILHVLVPKQCVIIDLGVGRVGEHTEEAGGEYLMFCNNPFFFHSASNKWVYMCCCLHHLWQPLSDSINFYSDGFQAFILAQMLGIWPYFDYIQQEKHRLRHSLAALNFVQVRQLLCLSRVHDHGLLMLQEFWSAGEHGSTNWLRFWGWGYGTASCHVTVRWPQLPLLCILLLSTILLPRRSIMLAMVNIQSQDLSTCPTTQCKFDSVVLLSSLFSNFLLQVDWGCWENILESILLGNEQIFDVNRTVIFVFVLKSFAKRFFALTVEISSDAAPYFCTFKSFFT